MPMSRYEIKNEYSLADPELYQTADKDDPEALLEGVAMAGLVGLLRQLGDLAEFAAEIFHNLHEEVVATAARGHGLMVRVQQLEAEVPSLEKAFLSQTDHSSFLYHSGVDWHPHIRMDQNLVTQGDLPRFIMDSYEECREPPRLFLLDKFDVAGAGACLKRYTDPSFYKVESTDISSANMQREKKILKRKGPRWKNGEVPEASPLSHSKLHQLFLEERVENGVSNSSSRVKLKRRLNGYPFDTKTGKSYMEKLLRSSSPDHEELYEVAKDPAPLILTTNEQDEPKSEVTEEKQSSPGTLSVRRKRSTSSSTVREKITKPNDIPVDDIISRSPNLYPSTEADENSSARDNGSCDRVIGMDVESKREDLLGYQSDDISSEIDYVDAPSTVETEMDTDSEMRVNGASTSAYSNKQPLAYDANEENLYSRSDSQSIGDSISDAGSSSSKKDMLNHSSDSSNNPAENSIYDKTSLEKIPWVGIPENDVVDSVFDQKNADGHFSIQQYSETMVHEGSCTGLDEVTIHKAEFEQLNYSMSSSDSPPTVTHSDSSDIVRKDSLSKRQLHGTVSNDDEEVKKTILITDPYHSSVSDSDSQKNDDCPGPSAGEHSVSESDCKNMHVSSASEHFPGIIYPDNQQPGEVDRDFFELPENLTAKYPDLSQNRENFEPWVSSKEDIKDETANGSLNVSTPTENELPSIVEASIDRKLGETSLSIDQINHIEDNQTNNFVDSQISSTQSNSLHPLDSPDWDGAKSSGHGEYANPEDDVTKYDTVVSPSSSSSEVLGLDDSCMKNDVPHSDLATLTGMRCPEKLEVTVEDSCNTSEKLEDSADNLFSATKEIEVHAENICSPPEKLEEAAQSSCLSPEELEEPTKNFHYALENSENLAEKLYSTSEKFEDPAGMLYNGETDGIILCASPSEQEIDEVSADLKSLNEAHVLGESDEEQHKEATSEELASSIPATSDDHYTLNDNSLRLSSNEVDVDGKLYSEDARFDDPENDKNVLPQLVLGFMEEADETKADTSVHDAVFINSINHDYHQPEVADGNNPNSHLNPEMDNSLEVSHSTRSQSLPENDRVDQEYLHEGGCPNCDFDAPLHSNHERERSMLPEKADLLPDKLAQELSESDEVSSFTVNREQITDHYIPQGFSEDIILQAKDDLSSDHHGEELQNSSPRSPITHQEMLELNDHQGASDSSASFSPINHTNQFSSELPTPCDYEFNLPLFPNNPFAPNFTPPDPFTGTDQVNLTDLPPLPPLPPVQWRLGKFQQSLSATDLSMSQRDVSSREISKSIDDLSTFNASTKESFVHMIPETREEKAENSMLIKEAGTIHQTADVTFKTETENKQLQFVPNDTSIPVVHNFSQEAIELPPKIGNESSPNTEASATSEDRVTAAEAILTQSPLSMINTPHETVVDTQPKIENQKMQLENETTAPADDSGVGNGVRSLKARLPSPLVDDASVLDKSKLRKVTERVRPELKTVDERDSFLQQIKTRSFNLKPAVSSRPSIRGPSTNLKVAAILEKANAIRQALAGSDEDEDSWSDS